MYFILNVLYHGHLILTFDPWWRQNYFIIKINFQSSRNLHWIALCSTCSTRHWTCDWRFVKLGFLEDWLSVAHSCKLIMWLLFVCWACGFVLVMLDRSGCVGVWYCKPCWAWHHSYGRVHLECLFVKLVIFISLLKVHIPLRVVLVCTGRIRCRLQLPVVAPLGTETRSFDSTWHPASDSLQNSHIPGILSGSVIIWNEAIFFNEKIMASVWVWRSSYGILEKFGFVHSFI